jgi:putative PIN family toxin of toxin-antitoxin system
LKLLLDTNVLIAAFISRGNCSELLEHAVSSHTVVCSNYTLEEFREKLIAKFAISAADAKRAAALLRSRFEIVVPAVVPKSACPDEDDLPVLGSAVAGGCACAVTGDGGLVALGAYQGIPILSPAEFWQQEDKLDRTG